MSNGYVGIQYLCKACKNGDLDVIKNAIADGTDLNTLVFASENGHLEIVKVLIAAGASVNEADNDGWTPLLVRMVT